MAAVTSTSTRAPIYKAFACRENIGDVTAKGECISNIADLVHACCQSLSLHVFGCASVCCHCKKLLNAIFSDVSVHKQTFTVPLSLCLCSLLDFDELGCMH